MKWVRYPWWSLGILVGALALSGVHAAAAGEVAGNEVDTALACDAAGAAAEQRFELPAGLLRAIGRVESGRRDPSTGRVAAWPWTINAEGRGQSFQNRADALARARLLQASGVASIDVGCFQVNLVHHPAAFPSLDDGFEPRSNAEYAARFLISLKVKTGSWDGAIAAYHSATPERGGPYRDRVAALWSRDGGGPVGGVPVGGVPVGGIPVGDVPATPPVAAVRVVTWSATTSAGPMRIWTPSAAGQAASVIRITRG